MGGCCNLLNLLIWVGEKTWNIPLSHVCSWIWSAITLSGNILKGTTKNLIVEFGILKKFNINIHPWKTPLPKQVLWSPPLCGWTKCNSDRAARGSPGVASREGTFRDYRGSILGCFSWAHCSNDSYWTSFWLRIALFLARMWDQVWWFQLSSPLLLSLVGWEQDGLTSSTLPSPWVLLHLTSMAKAIAVQIV